MACPVFFFAFALPPHSLPSKCWHISFKWSIFISHSLFPLLPYSCLHSLRRSWVCLRGINPQTTTSLPLFFLSFTPPLPSCLPSPSVSSDIYCQRLDVSVQLSKTSSCRRLWDRDCYRLTVSVGTFCCHVTPFFLQLLQFYYLLNCRLCAKWSIKYYEVNYLPHSHWRGGLWTVVDLFLHFTVILHLQEQFSLGHLNVWVWLNCEPDRE